MRLLRLLANRLYALLFANRLDADARKELRAHFERQVEMHLSAGLTPAAARRAATLEFGDTTQLAEACRDAHGLAWWDALRGDVRYALRQMRRRPGFSATVVLTVAIGVGATTAVFGVVDAVLLRPLPYPNADRLYSLYEVNRLSAVGRTRASALNFIDWRDQASSFDGMAAHIGNGFTLTGRGEPAFVMGQQVTTNLLDVLGVQPVLGRTFHPHEAEAGAHRVAIVTDGLWRRYFNADPSIVGRTTIINGLPYEVVGVMPRSFQYPSDRYEILTPIVTSGTSADGPPINRQARYLRVVARLKPRVSEKAARDELTAIGLRLAERFPEANENVSIGLARLIDETVAEARMNLLVALTAVAIVLLIACVNVAGLMIARSSARSRELGVRMAIGASRGRLVRQLATEGVMLFIAGGSAGLALAAWLLGAVSFWLPSTTPRLHEIAIDWRFLAFGVALTLCSGLVFSVFPALNVARIRGVPDVAGHRGAISANRRTQRTRAALIVAQIAAAIVLLSGAALAIRSLARVHGVDPGFDRAGAMTFGFVMRDTRYPTANDMRAFAGRVWETLESAPGIGAAGLTTALPLSDQNVENLFTVEGSPVPPGEDAPLAGMRGVAGHYSAAMGVRLLQGRDLLPTDGSTSELVVVVTADFVERYVRSANPIGVRVKMGGTTSTDPWRTIVGVIPTIRHNALDKAPRPEVWLPLAQMSDDLLTTWLRGVYVAARTSRDPATILPDVRTKMRALDPELPLVGTMSLDELARKSTSSRRLETSVLVGFAALAVILAAVGLFGLLVFFVAQHVQEFGVRLALGATPRTLLALVLRRGLTLLAAGVAIGLPGAFAIGRGMSHLLYGIAPTDPVAIGAGIAVLTAVTVAACGLPARRAMKTDPLVALRHE